MNLTFNETLNKSQKGDNISFFELISLISILLYFVSLVKNDGVNQLTNKKELSVIEPNNKKIDPTLHKIIGLESVKEEIRYYMDFINNKDKYIEWNVKVPKGILLAGPPGTGKTLLVKTLANSLNIPVINCSGSDFVEVFVGIGASRIRNVFKKAKEYEKCIIFIDEIDAIGKKRGLDNNSERDNTLNQLLVEMDGFTNTTNTIIFAATNMIQNLDPALTRSGRFDKKIYFDPPNFKERKQLFELYLTNIDFEKKITLDILSERTAGLTGADIANACNQAKINALQNNINIISINEKNLQEAIDEIMIGREKRERTMNKLELERVSHHEAGHAIIGFILKHSSPPIKVSIIPRGESSLGFSQEKSTDNKILTDDMIISKIAVLLGGRCAEKLIYGNYSTGAVDDIEKLTRLAINYCEIWGLHKNIGPINLRLYNELSYSISQNNFKEVKDLIINIEYWVIKTLKKFKRYIISIANELINNETIDINIIKKILPSTCENSETINLSKLT